MASHISTPLRILLLSDNPTASNPVVKSLEWLAIDHDLSKRAYREEEFDREGSNRFDLILLDLQLSETEGAAKIKALRNQAQTTALIVLVESNDEHLSSAVFQAGADDCLSKEELGIDHLERAFLSAVKHRSLESKLREQEVMQRSIFEAQPDAILVLDQKYEIVFFNPSAASLLGAEGISLIGETFPFEISPTQTPEVEIPEANGNSRVVQFKVSELIWRGDTAKLIILRDITHCRHLENALKQAQQRLAVTIDSVADAVIASDAEGIVEYFNAEASRLTGLPDREAKGKALSEVLCLKIPQTGERIAIPDEESLQGWEKAELYLIPAKQNNPVLVTVDLHPILDQDNNPHASITILKAVADRKIAEATSTAEDIASSINLLAAGIAHDFNNMLSAILGNISLARINLPKKDASAEKLLAAEDAALQAKSLTQQLLSLSKGGFTSLETTAIQEIVEQSAHFVLRGSNVKCDVEKEEGLWAVDADKGQISQVIHNLTINADQAMPSGGIIHLRMNNCRLGHDDVPQLIAGEYVCIEVADQGIGIGRENIKRIFDPYFTTKDDGNGLGLASSQTIINNHHGAITVESELDKGTCFRVYLPKTNKNIASLEKPEAQATENIHQGSGRILVMDDMEAMMLVAGEILNVLGYEVEFTTNGKQAIEAYKKAKESGKPFDAVVFDLTVPGGMGGEEAGNILLQYDPDLVAIASSGYTTSNIMSDYKNSAFKAVVPKPYRIKEMSEALNRALNKPDKPTSGL